MERNLLALFDALGHPHRLRVLLELGDTDRALSPVELAGTGRFAGVTLGTTSYHVRAAAAAGLIQLADEARVRGAVQHFYALTAKGRRLLNDVDALLPGGER